MVQSLEQAQNRPTPTFLRLQWFQTHEAVLNGLLQKYGGNGHFIVVGSVGTSEAEERSDLDLADKILKGADDRPDLNAIRKMEDDTEYFRIRPPNFHVELKGIYKAKYDRR